jgi:hypothetical protein
MRGSTPSEETARGAGVSPRRGALWVLLALHGATAAGLLLSLNGADSEACEVPFSGSWAGCDQFAHLGLINYFIRQPLAFFDYPDPDLVATLPGLHLLVAWIARALGIAHLEPDTWLRIVPFLLGAATLALLWRTLGRICGDAWYAAVLCIPVLWSNYFYLSSLFLVTENPAYLGFVFVLSAYLWFPERGLAIGIAASAMVMARQIFLPVVLAHVVALWPPRSLDRRRALALATGILMPVAVMAAYFVAWGGRVPPDAQGVYAEDALVETGPVVQAIALFGLLAIPYGILVYPALRKLSGRRVASIAAAAGVCALLVWILVPTTRDSEAGRAGAFLWLLARMSPAIGDRALLALPCLLLGCIGLGLALELARLGRYRPLELATWGLYVAALATQSLSYQRYGEVVTLIVLSVTAARFGPPTCARMSLFALIFAAKLAATVVIPQGG